VPTSVHMSSSIEYCRNALDGELRGQEGKWVFALGGADLCTAAAFSGTHYKVNEAKSL
jgi:hypothetical protein